jgi:hypothetical protein
MEYLSATPWFQKTPIAPPFFPHPHRVVSDSDFFTLLKQVVADRREKLDIITRKPAQPAEFASLGLRRGGNR